ncbi:hypothetical protein MPH_09074 [Macrophomina phaseolina MS6]|uniref:Uncharacterized protein n=1 Tax=Macrophomina phaseolina (strain MS6) TaxID=1126212 RepID=K2SA63_MACPH|nr:hypothetical protein MPH_09074 [Macrophomina phaseolina MS6]
MDRTLIRARGKRKAPASPPADLPPGAKRRPGRPRTKRPPSPPWEEVKASMLEQLSRPRVSLIRKAHPEKRCKPAKAPSKWSTPLPWPEEYRTTQSQSLPQSQTQPQSLGAQTPLIKKKKRRSSYWRKLSPLERMPAEVLQHIFLECMNTDLPVASIELLHKLNSDHIEMEFALRVLYWPEEDERMGAEELAEMQNKLLSLRFFDWDFYKRYAAKACQRFGSWQWLEDLESGAFLEDYIQRHPDFEVLDRFNLNCEHVDQIPPFLRFHEKTPIPPRYLKGPWDEQKQMMLRFLFIQNLGIDTENSTAAETLIEGLMDLAKGSAHIDIAQWLICIAIASEITLPQKMLRRAVIDGGCDKDLVESLLTWSLHGDTEYFDPMLWNWAERTTDKEKGRWLMDQLKATATNKEELAAQAEAEIRSP